MMASQKNNRAYRKEEGTTFNFVTARVELGKHWNI